MEMIQNKIAESGLVTLDLEAFMPAESEIKTFDIKPFLFRELILKEKDFRLALAEYDFSVYENTYVGVYCSADALIPMWAYMLIMSYLQPFAMRVVAGDERETLKQISLDRIHQLDVTEYTDARIILKGCGKRNASGDLYIAMTQKLLPVAKNIMFGEPCSTVPVYKKKKAQ